MPVVTTSELVVSPGIYSPSTSGIKILPYTDSDGNNNLIKANSILHKAVTESENSVTGVFTPGSGLFYGIEEYNSSSGSARQLIRGEEGLGILHKYGSEFFLERQRIFKVVSPSGTQNFPQLKPAYSTTQNVILTTYLPTGLQELASPSNSIIGTVESFTPKPIELAENTILGRTTGDIGALSASEVSNIIGPVNVISSFQENTDPIISQSSHFELAGSDSLVIASTARLSPRLTNPDNLQGSIYYNKGLGHFMGYDGTSWRKLAWAD